MARERPYALDCEGPKPSGSGKTRGRARPEVGFEPCTVYIGCCVLAGLKGVSHGQGSCEECVRSV